MAGMKFRLTGADIPKAMERLTGWGITVYDFELVDDITAVFWSDAAFCEKIQVLTRYGCDIHVLRDGRISFLDILRRRWILITGVFILLILTAYIPTRVFFVGVEGNAQLPEKLILEIAEECGIRFGAERRSIRSEQVKNQLLQLLPQLQWAGINTRGCTAVISVRERQPEEVTENCDGIGNIVSSRDGIIQSVTVLQGSARCKPGQAVREGEILISGYTDCGLFIRAEIPQGEVYALTNRSATAVFPRDCRKKGRMISEQQKFALLIGKKRINLYKDSGILDGSCDKMYSYSYVTLPGEFQLPLALIRERCVLWETVPYIGSEESAEAVLKGFSVSYLRSQMMAGQIHVRNEKVAHQQDHSVLTGSYACSEMIGQILYEERFQSNGENN